MLTAIGDVFTQLITWVGNFVTALTGQAGVLKDLLPIFAIGIGISLLLVCVKIVRKVCWGA